MSWVAGATLVTVAVGSCAAPDEAAPPFPGSAASLDALGGAVLCGLTAGDAAAVERHRLTRTEHDEVIWPELPASRPGVGFPSDYAWTNIQNRHRRSLGRTGAMLEGRDVVFRGVECRGRTQRFETFRVHTDCWVLFDVGSDGRRYEAQLFQDVVVRAGGYKYFRLYDEEPRPLGLAGVRRRGPARAGGPDG